MAHGPTIIDVARAAGASRSALSLATRDGPAALDESRDDERRAMAGTGCVRHRSAAPQGSGHEELDGPAVGDLGTPVPTKIATPARTAVPALGNVTVNASTDVDAAPRFDGPVGPGPLPEDLALGRRVGADIRVAVPDATKDWALAVASRSSVRRDIAAVGRGNAAAVLDWIEPGRRPIGTTRARLPPVAPASSLGP